MDGGVPKKHCMILYGYRRGFQAAPPPPLPPSIFENLHMPFQGALTQEELLSIGLCHLSRNYPDATVDTKFLHEPDVADAPA